MSQGESHEEVGHTVNTHTNTDTHTHVLERQQENFKHTTLYCVCWVRTHTGIIPHKHKSVCMFTAATHTNNRCVCVCVCGDVFVVGLSVKHKPRHTSRRLIFRTVLSVSAQTCYQTKPHTVCCRAHTDTHTHTN